MKARKYVVKNNYKGIPSHEDYELVEYELPPLKDQEILVKTEFLSVDSYLWQMHVLFNVPYDQYACQVGTILESKNPDYPVGSRVGSHKGWCDYYIINPNETSEESMDKPFILPDFRGLPVSYGVGAAGMHGLTAYFGLIEVCKPKSGDTVVVSGASGSVGSIAGQIAKIKGCKVIGLVGSEEKAKWVEELGFDAVINYKTQDIRETLKTIAPTGVDCYFDNVGGEISSQIIYCMNKYGRVCVCGTVDSAFLDFKDIPKATGIMQAILWKELSVSGYHVTKFYDKFYEALEELVSWLKKGQLKTKEHVTEGLENVVDAFINLCHGKIFGRACVKV